MLTTALIKFLVALVGVVFSLFPTWAPPSGAGLSAFAAANIVLPLDTISVLMGVTAGFMIAGGTIWVIMKAINLVRGSGA